MVGDHGPLQFAGDDARQAKTVYKTLRRGAQCTLVELKPFTGRTHQLRVHLAFLGHPILGDGKYGKNNEFSRLALHAVSIGFIHPKTKEFIEKKSDIPLEFREFLNKHKIAIKARKP